MNMKNLNLAAAWLSFGVTLYCMYHNAYPLAFFNLFACFFNLACLKWFNYDR